MTLKSEAEKRVAAEARDTALEEAALECERRSPGYNTHKIAYDEARLLAANIRALKSKTPTPQPTDARTVTEGMQKALEDAYIALRACWGNRPYMHSGLCADVNNNDPCTCGADTRCKLANQIRAALASPQTEEAPKPTPHPIAAGEREEMVEIVDRVINKLECYSMLGLVEKLSRVKDYLTQDKGE